MRRDAFQFAGVWCLWIAAQVMALGLFAAQVPLSSRFPAPLEDSAAAAVLAVQVALIVLLNGALLPDYWAAVAAGSGGAIVLLAAELLAGHRPAEVVWPFLLLAAWLCGMVKKISPKIQALLAVLSLAGPAVLWGAAEAGTANRLSAFWAFSPPVGAVSTCLHSPGRFAAFALPLTLILAKLLQDLGFRFLPRRHPGT